MDVEMDIGHGLEHSGAVTLMQNRFSNENYTPTPGDRPSYECQFFFPQDWHPVDLVRHLFHLQASGELLPWLYDVCSHR
eukprot:12126387-Alexandrium_andersonii.AAC.1